MGLFKGLFRRGKKIVAQMGDESVELSRASGVTDIQAYISATYSGSNNTPLQYDTIVRDALGEWNTGTYTFTAKESGTYIISGYFWVDNAVDAIDYGWELEVNTARRFYHSDFADAAAQDPSFAFGQTIYLKAGDEVQILFVNGGSSRAILGTDSRNILTINKVR